MNVRGDFEQETAPQLNPPMRRIIFLSKQGNSKQNYFPNVGYVVETLEDVKSAGRMLTEPITIYELIILDDQLFGSTIDEAIQELKGLNLRAPILVLTSDESLDYQTRLVEAGADDVLLTTETVEEVARRLTLSLKRNAHHQAFIQRNHKLYESTRLTRLFQVHTEPQTLIEEAIRLICQTFALSGVAVTIPENGILRIFSGQAKLPQPAQVIQTLRDLDPNEPFNRVVNTGITEIFEDITLDLHYVPLPMLSDASSAIFMPLRYQRDTLGAVAVFGNASNPINLDDLGIFEVIATQLAVALQNSNFYKAQRVHIHLNQTLLRAWQSLLMAQTSEGIAQTLCELVEQLSSVDRAIVWINRQEGAQAEVFTKEPQGRGEQIFTQLLQHGEMDDLIRRIDQGPQIVFQLGLSPDDPLLPLFHTLHTRQLIFMSIEDSTRLIGGILISVANDRQFSLEDANLARNLSYAAGQALERMMLIQAMEEKSGRLEAILRSVTEGIFFVDGDGIIAFCNPQVTELTYLNPYVIVGQRPELLLNLLAEQATDVETAKAHFYNAVNTLQRTADTDRSYPIVELTLRKTNQQVHIEFIASDGFNASSQSWIGLVRTSNRAVSKWDNSSEAIDLLLHTLHATGLQLRNFFDGMVNANNNLSMVEQKLLLDELQKGATNFQSLLEYYAKFYNLNITEPIWNYETLNFGELVENTVRTRFNQKESNISYDAALSAPQIEVNRQLIEQALIRLLENAIKRTPSGEPVTVRIKEYKNEVHLSVESLDLRSLPAGELSPFDLVDTSDPNTGWADIYLYYALTQFNRCRIWAENRTANRRAVIISLPKLHTLFAQPANQVKESAEVLAVSAGAPLRTPRAVMIIRGISPILRTLTSQLEDRGYDTLVYEMAEEAVRDVNLTRFDLIIMDGHLTEGDSLDVYKQLRRRTEVPLVIVASKATNLERLQALKAGVDDYITEPISMEELLAKISVLFKRQHLADRTEQPLDLGDLRIDFARRIVYVDHKPVSLTRIEYDLLRTLAVNMGQVLTHQQLLEKVWGPEYHSENQYLWVNISRLRKKLEPTSHIYNQQGIGYIFQPV